MTPSSLSLLADSPTAYVLKTKNGNMLPAMPLGLAEKFAAMFAANRVSP
jgi:hypothetical protein